MSDLHMESLSDAELLDIAGKALAKLHGRYAEEGTASSDAVEQACDAFDDLRDLLNGPGAR